jgi:hypothetical protein
VKTTTGIKDLDSETELSTNVWYNVTVLYSGSDFEVYLNGDLDAFTSWSGTILTTTIDFTIGQVLPNNQGFNFSGALDDIRIYNYALSVEQIRILSGGTTGVGEDGEELLPTRYSLEQNYPNPFNPTTTIVFTLPSLGIIYAEGRGRVGSHGTLKVFDVLGRELATLINEMLEPGKHTVTFDASTLSSGVYFYRLTSPKATITRKMILLR